MASMSYCAFENTCQELQRIVWMLDDAAADGVSLEEFVATRSSPEESDSVGRIEMLCEDVMSLLEQLRSRD